MLEDRSTPSTFTGGVPAAAGDIDGDGYADVVTGAGPGDRPVVQLISGVTGQATTFFAHEADFRGGVNIAVGDIDGDRDPENVAGAGGGPRARVFDARTGARRGDFLADEPSLRGGVDVATGDIDGDGRAEILAGAGADSEPSVAIFRGTELAGVASTNIQMMTALRQHDRVQSMAEVFAALSRLAVPT